MKTRHTAVSVFKNRRLKVGAILCPAVCISDALSKAGMFGAIIEYVTSHPFLLFVGKERTDMATTRNSNSK